MQPASDDHNNTESIEHYNRGALHTHLNMCLLCGFSISPLALSQNGVRQFKKASINPRGILGPTAWYLFAFIVGQQPTTTFYIMDIQF